jgi:hypothetical protein
MGSSRVSIDQWDGGGEHVRQVHDDIRRQCRWSASIVTSSWAMAAERNRDLTSSAFITQCFATTLGKSRNQVTDTVD